MGAVTDIATKQVRDNKPTGSGGGGMETRLAILETKVDGLDKRIDKIDKRMDSLEIKMDNLIKEVHQGFSGTNKEMTGQSRWMAGIAIGIIGANIAVAIALATYLKQSTPPATQPQVIYLQPAPIQSAP